MATKQNHRRERSVGRKTLKDWHLKCSHATKRRLGHVPDPRGQILGSNVDEALGQDGTPALAGDDIDGLFFYEHCRYGLEERLQRDVAGTLSKGFHRCGGLPKARITANQHGEWLMDDQSPSSASMTAFANSLRLLADAAVRRQQDRAVARRAQNTARVRRQPSRQTRNQLFVAPSS
jgi:hypothetical protein